MEKKKLLICICYDSVLCIPREKSKITRFMIRLLLSILNTCCEMVIFAGMGVQDYCEDETFEAKCEQDEVITIGSALYGRMRVGKCVREDYGYIGCYVDVTDLVNKRCSGGNECRLEVTDNEFEGIKPCPDESKSYLQIEYTCMKRKFWLHLRLRNVRNNGFSIYNILFRCSCLVMESLSQIMRNRDKEYCFLIHIP